MKRKDSCRTIASIALVFVGFLVLIIISAGVQFQFEKLESVEYWLNVLVRLAVTMVLYNAIFALDLNNRKNADNTRYSVAVMTKRKKVKKIKEEQLFDALDAAIKAENAERYATECSRRMHKVTVRLDFKDLPTDIVNIDEWLDSAAKKYLLSDKDKKRLKKVVLEVLNGKVQIDELTGDDLLDMLGEDIEKTTAVRFHAKKITRNQNLAKAALFLVGVAFMTIFSWAPTWTGIVYEIITNSFLLVGATFSAINNAVYFLRRKTAVFENQNLLITKRMGITDEYFVNKNGGK